MTGRSTALPTPAEIDALYRAESRRVLATLIRVLGDFDLAGLYLIEARDLNEAIRVAGKIPPARFGSIEMRPVRKLRSDGNSGPGMTA
jgi:YCII-related domain